VNCRGWVAILPMIGMLALVGCASTSQSANAERSGALTPASAGIRFVAAAAKDDVDQMNALICDHPSGSTKLTTGTVLSNGAHLSAKVIRRSQSEWLVTVKSSDGSDSTSEQFRVVRNKSRFYVC
jgi:hypothetical protein